LTAAAHPPQVTRKKWTMPKPRRVKADTNQPPATNSPAVTPDDDWWSWAIIAVIFAISATAIWAPVILGNA